MSAVGLGVAQMLVLLPIPLLLRDAFDHAIPERQVWALARVGLAVVGLQATSALLSVWARSRILAVVKTAMFEIRRALLAGRFALPRSASSTIETGRAHDLIVHDTERVDLMVNAVCFYVLPSVALAAGVAVILVWLSPVLTLATVALLPLAMLVSHWLRRRLLAATRQYHASFEQFNRGTWSTLEAAELTRIHAAEDAELARASKTMAELQSTSLGLSWLQAAATTAHSTLTMVLGVVILILGGTLLARGALSLGDLMSFYVALALLRTSASLGLSVVPQIIEGWEAGGRVGQALSYDATPIYGGTRVVSLTGAVRFEAVSFAYDDRTLLRAIDLSIVPGATTGISGESGAGKTTLVLLLIGLYRVQSGRVVLDDIPLDELDVRHVRRQVGMLPQDPLLLPLTIAENIAFGVDPAPSDAEVRDAATLAGAHAFISRLPDGYDTSLGTRGVRLSGGQRQRIALARALIRRPRVLILDEPTNHLGVDAVMEVLTSLAAWPSPPATLVISHDGELLSRLPRVMRLSDGILTPVASPAPTRLSPLFT